MKQIDKKSLYLIEDERKIVNIFKDEWRMKLNFICHFTNFPRKMKNNFFSLPSFEVD